MSRILVIQYEQFFALDAIDNDITGATREGLDILRGYGGARIIGSYETEDDPKFRDKRVASITVDAPVIITVDVD